MTSKYVLCSVSVGEVAFWIHIWYWSGGMFSHVLFVKLNVHDWRIKRVYDQCAWILSFTNGVPVSLSCIIIITVSINPDHP